MFKIGETVVCAIPFEGLVLIGGIWRPKDKSLQPQLNEMYTIVGFDSDGWLILAEFKWENSYNPSKFRKLDHTFAEEVTARIEEEINQENLIEA